MTCAACGTENRDGAKFCVECGSPLRAACPSCGSAVQPGAKFCPECGARLAAEAPSPASFGAGHAPAAPQGATPAAIAATERRLVSVLFADLVGFTALAEGRDSEAVRELLGTYFERATEVVGRYGGTVEKFIGDAVMAVWGTPVAHEDDAERAVRAALDLVDAVREMGRDLAAPDLQARAGVLTGEAAVTLGARNQGMVAGDLVNTASRLQSAAEPGTVLVGEATRRAAEGAIAFEAVGERSLKGKAVPVTAYRALRVIGTVRGTIRIDALEPPFVGRDTEFRLLRELFHATGRDRRARLVSLTGQAGIGKSRLAWELQKYLDGIREQVFWHHGRSPAYGEGVTFWALGEMVRKRAGLAESDDEPTALARIDTMLAEHVSDEEERAFVAPALRALLGLDEPPAGGRDRLFAGWRLFLERLGERSTVVLVFEDLHWADDGLLDFIDHVLEWSRSYPILVVTLARPELLDRRPTWGARAHQGSSLALGPLGEPDMRALLAGLAPGLPEAAVRSILGRADGIPLYAVETVRMLVADGRLEPDGEGHYRPTGKLAELEVPATLQALIAARLDALDPAERALLQDASIIGKTFTVEALAAVGGGSPAELEPRLRALVVREVLTFDTDPASPERGQYGFVQALIREVAYGTLARRERRARHLAAARYFEARGEDELAPVLASHYLAAYRAAPDDADAPALATQARIALRAAAERADSLGSYAGAATYYEQALELSAGDPAEQADLLERAGTAANLNGQYERAAALMSRAIERWREAAAPERTGRAIALLGLSLIAGGQGDRALELLEAGRREFAGPEHEVARAHIVARLAHFHVRRGSATAAFEAAEEVLPVAEAQRIPELLVDALISKSAGLAQRGREAEGLILLEGAARTAVEHGLIAQRFRAMVNTVVQLIDQNPWRAYETGLEAIEQARRFGVRPTLIFAVLNTVEIAFRVGDWARAASIIESVLPLELETSDRGVVVGNALMLDLLRGRRDEERERWLNELVLEGDPPVEAARMDLRLARGQLTGAYRETFDLAMAQAVLDDLNAPAIYERAGRAALWSGDAADAREAAQRFAALHRVSTLPTAQLAGIEAGVLALEGRPDEAVERYRDVLRRYRDMRLEFDGALARLDAVRLLGADRRETRAWADEARAVFTRLGAAPHLAILDGLVGDGPMTESPDRSGSTGPGEAVRVGDAASG